MITITINVQIATTIQPIARCQRAPRSPPSSTESSSSVSHGDRAARTTSAIRERAEPTAARDRRGRRRWRRPRRSGCRTRSTACQAWTASASLPRSAESVELCAAMQAQLGTRASSRTSPSDITPVSSCQLLASHRAQRWNTTSRPAIRMRIVIERAFCTTSASVHWWPPCRVTRGSSARSARTEAIAGRFFSNRRRRGLVTCGAPRPSSAG